MTRNIGLRRQRQQGAVILTVALMMFFLLGFMAFALDFGRAFVVKTELQTSMDSCALSAAQELDGAADSITRAVSAGLTAGNLNKVNFQSAQDLVTADDITFLDSDYVVTTVGTAAKYARCMRTQSDVQMLLMGALDFFSQGSGNFPSARDVTAMAVATRSSAQSTCPIPVALRPKVGGTAPHYGFSPGEWVTLLMGPGEATNGEIGWANLDGSNSASETVAEMNGKCGTEIGDTLGTPGVQANVVDVWNYRFGIYKNMVDPSTTLARPDFSGYAYTAKNWPSQANAYGGPIPAGAHATADNFIAKRLAFANCADTGMQLRGGPNSCEGIIGQSLNSFQKLVPAGIAMGGHRQFGANRRIVLVPVVNDAKSVIDFGCMLMLQPLSIPMAPVKLEYLGNAGEVGSPCTTSGLPGGAAGPLVPVLVR